MRALLILGESDYEPFRSTASVTHVADSSVQVTVHIDMKSGWHINSHEPGSAMLVPTTVAVLGDDAKITSLDYPNGALLDSPGTDEAIFIYEGTVEIPIEIEFDTAIPKNVILEITAQPCGDNRCLAPITQKIVIFLD